MARADGRPVTRLNIVADAHIWGVQEAFGTLPGHEVTLRALEAADITHGALKDADALITRSSTRVNESLLSGTPVRFVATATIGDDHLDKPWLEASGIGHANAAGSSTGSVLEYMLSALLELHARGLIKLPETCLGIIGAGRIGGSLARICEALSMPVLCNDPPRARKEGSADLASLDDLLQQADVLSLHTPLHRSGEDRTLHLLGTNELARFKGRGIINAGRGACLDNAALLDWLDGDAARFAVLDCWENEPAISPALLAHAQLAIGTPHIAGHSLDGKAANTVYARRALCEWLGVNAEWDLDGLLPPAALPASLACTSDAWTNLHAATRLLYDITRDDADLRAEFGSGEANPDDIARRFSTLRRHYPVRRSWGLSQLSFRGPDPNTSRLAKAMGIKVV